MEEGKKEEDYEEEDDDNDNDDINVDFDDYVNVDVEGRRLFAKEWTWISLWNSDGPQGLRASGPQGLRASGPQRLSVRNQLYFRPLHLE